MVQDDDPLARRLRRGQRSLQPSDLRRAEGSVPRLGVRQVRRLRPREAVLGELPPRVPLGRGEERHVVAVEDDEAQARTAKIVICPRHAEPADHPVEILRADLEIVVPEHEAGLVPQGPIDRQDAIEAREVAVDHVAEGHDEAEILRVQHLHRGGELAQALGVVATHRGVRRRIGILRIGDHAEAQRARLGPRGRGEKRGAAGEHGSAGQHGGLLRQR